LGYSSISCIFWQQGRALGTATAIARPEPSGAFREIRLTDKQPRMAGVLGWHKNDSYSKRIAYAKHIHDQADSQPCHHDGAIHGRTQDARPASPKRPSTGGHHLLCRARCASTVSSQVGRRGHLSTRSRLYNKSCKYSHATPGGGWGQQTLFTQG